MDKKNVKGSANKAIGLSLLAVTAASMTPVIAPNGVDNAYAAPTKAEATALAGAVELNGPAGSDNYKDDVAGKYWYTKSGSFKVTVDDKKYSGVKIEVNGQEVLPPTQVTEAKNEFKFNLDGDSVIRVTAGTWNEDTGGGSDASDGGGDGQAPNEEFIPEDVTNFNVGIDNEAPEATGTTSGKVEENGGKTYITKDTEFKVDANDAGTGVEDVIFQKKTDGKWNDSITGNTLKGKTGEFRVLVVDKIGNERTYSFNDLFGVSGKLKKVDENDQNTTISAFVDDKKITDAWLPGRDGSDRKSHVVTVKIKKSSGIHLGDSISVNGTDPGAKKTEDEDGNKTFTFNLKDIPRAEDGIYNMQVDSRYILGETSHKEYTIKADYGLPEITGSKLTGDYTIDDGKIYVNGDAYYNGNVEDLESGVKKVEVFRSDVEGGAESYDFEQTGNSIRFKLEQGRNYWIKVTDGVGNSVSKNLEELDLGGKDVIEDDDAPVIVETDKKKPDYTDDDKNQWYKDPFKMDFSITDDNMKSITTEVNGDVKTPTIKENSKYSIDLSQYTPAEGARYNVTIRAVDRAGNQSEFTRTIFTDSEAPSSLKASLEGDYKDRSFGVFSKEDLILHAKSNDGVGSGTAGYQLLDASTKKVLQDSKDGNIKLTDGAFLLVAYDNIGNKTAPVSLKELLGTNSNEFYTDATAPKIDVDRNDPIYKNWYDDDVAYTVKFSDNTALYEGKVRVNGKEVTSFTSGKIEKNHNLTFNTSEVKADATGAYTVVVEGIDAAGNTVKWNETIRIDKINPEIKSFTFTEPGLKEGQSITKSDDYGYYFKGATSVNIKVEDKAPSSGAKEIAYVLRNGNGSIAKRGTATVSGDTARVQIPSHFKGYIDAHAIDNVKNEGKTVHPSGIITEDRNWYVNTTEIDINLKDPGHKDHKNQNLYNGDTVATVPITQGVSGIREVEWGIGDTQIGKATVDANGHLSGSGFAINQRDKNLVLKANGTLPINGNTNDMKIWVRVMDRAGYTSDVDKTVSIDKDAPIIDVSYNDTNKSGYYNSNRTATISIKERNFDPKDVKLSGDYGSLGTWHQNGETWTNTITFSDETTYKWGLEYTDLAGNVGKGYSSEEFTVDKTAPKLSVDFNNNQANNGNFYKEGRTATVEVIDRNFDASRVNYRGDGSLSGWSHNGDRHTATVSFNEDGEYKFAVDSTDKAENKSNVHDEKKFIVDQAKPKLKIEGVKNGTSYKKDVGVKVTTGDKYIDTKASKVSLVGRERGSVKLEGSFNEKTGTFEIENFPKNKKMDDLYKLQAHIVDKAGNVEKEEVLFSVNRFGSNFDFLNKDFNGEFFQKLPSNVVMEQDSVDQLDKDGFSVTVLKNGSKMDIPKDSWNIKETGGKDSRWKYKVEVNKDLFDEDGKYQVQTYSKAKDGTKESSMDQEYAFGIDATDPEIYVSGIEEGKTYKVLDKEATIEVRDLSGVKELGVSINGNKVDYTEENGVYRVKLPVNSEVQSMSVEVKDLAGNTSQESVNDYFLTSSSWEALLHNTWFRIGMLLLLLALMVGVVIFGKRGYDRRQEQKRIEENRARALEASSSGGLSSEGELLAGAAGAEGVASLVGEDPEFNEEPLADPEASAAAQDDIETDVVGEVDQTTDMIDEADGDTDDFGGKE